jgi:hypothetical protein
MGGKGPFCHKSAYIIRDTVKVTGTNSGIPVNFVFYDDELKQAVPVTPWKSAISTVPLTQSVGSNGKKLEICHY